MRFSKYSFWGQVKQNNKVDKPLLYYTSIVTDSIFLFVSPNVAKLVDYLNSKKVIIYDEGKWTYMDWKDVPAEYKP